MVKRFSEAIKIYPSCNYFLRFTGDNPFVSTIAAKQVLDVIEKKILHLNNFDDWPIGMGCEVFSRKPDRLSKKHPTKYELEYAMREF